MIIHTNSKESTEELLSQINMVTKMTRYKAKLQIKFICVYFQQSGNIMKTIEFIIRLKMNKILRNRLKE
jgi:hypothetical protein